MLDAHSFGQQDLTSLGWQSDDPRIQERSCLPSTKTWHLILKQEQVVTNGAHKSLEGASYKSGKEHVFFSFTIYTYTNPKLAIL